MSSKTILYYGQPEPLPKALELRAGPLTMVFDPINAYLRHLRLGDHEVVRAIYAAVRDQNWATVPPQIANLNSEIGKDSFRLTFDIACRRGEIDFVWQGVITGENTGCVTFSFDGTARSDFLRNRIGVCILHPITECAGHPCAIEHTDGTIDQGNFPRHISPHQPFQEVRGVSYDVTNTGTRVHLAMEGDIFEMEDQRNWADASFKTYCTPLTLPLPHSVQKGDRVQQSVRLKLSGNVRPIPPVNLGPPELSIAPTPVVALPPLGLCVASHGRPLHAREIDRLKALRLSHLRVDLRLDDPGYPARLEQAAAEAGQLGAGLHVALILGGHTDPELPALVKHFERLKPRVLLWIILHESENPASEKTVQRVRPLLQEFAPAVPFAAGTRDFFTEVNRVRPQPGASSHICYSNNPQVHSFDNTTLVENLAGLAANVESARLFTPRPVMVSPITLRIRNNTNAAAEKPGALTELPSDVDPRQLSLFGAGWTLGSIARLATTGFVHSLTYYETTGWRGVMETESGPPLPQDFPSQPGEVFPLYHVLADIGEFPRQQIHPTHSSHPLQTEGLTLYDSQGRRRVLVTNLTSENQVVKIKTGTSQASVKYLDETNAVEAMLNPESFRLLPGAAVQSVSGKIELNLLPFALARVDIG